MNRRSFFIEAVRVAETWLPTIVPQSERQRIGDEIKAAFIFARADFVGVQDSPMATMAGSSSAIRQSKTRPERS